MLLARIITDVADDCLELTMQLRARGYQVEIVSPTAIPHTPADLEVRLEECDPEDVVAQAAQGTSVGDLWVYVAPGALDASVHPIRTIPLSSGLSEPMSAAKILPDIAKQKLARPPVNGALAIDARKEDSILAKLRTLPMPELVMPPVEPLSAVLIEIPDVARQEPLSDARTALPVQDEKASKTTPERKVAPSEPQPVRWLIDPAKPVPAAVTPLTIPIAPEPVRATISLPVENIRRTAVRKTRWNFRPLQVACGLSVLAFLAWVLILTGRPEATARSVNTGAAVPASRTVPVPQAASKPPVVEQTSQKPSAVRVQNSATAIVNTAVSPPKEATSVAKKVTKTRSHDEGLIAEDTVVFYDHKPVPPRAKAQSDPTVKRFTDQN
jgi:hypothetical protein